MLAGLFQEAFREPAECTIKVDDQEISDLYPYVTDVTVKCNRKEPSEATIKFKIRRDEEGKWAVIDEELFLNWKKILIEATFGSYSEEIMRGYVFNPRSSFPSEQCEATFIVQCRDESSLLDRNHRRETWGTSDQPMTDKEILEQILGDYPDISLNNDSEDGQSNLVLQQDATDITLMRNRSEANGYELLFQQGELYFGSPRLDDDPQVSIMVYAGPATNCTQFETSSDAHMPDKIAYEIAPAEGTEIVEEQVVPNLTQLGATPADATSTTVGDFVWRITRQGVNTETEMKAIAQAKANEFAFKLKAKGELDGTSYGHVLQVGKTVKVDGIGEMLGGDYYVDAVEHKFTQDGYKQTFTLLRNAYGE